MIDNNKNLYTKITEFLIFLIESIYTVFMLTIFGIIGYVISAFFDYSMFWTFVITFSVAILGTFYSTKYLKRISDFIYNEFIKEYLPNRNKRKITR